MFESINSIEVDRKNSLPVADLHARYRKTSTPVVFGDLSLRWPAYGKWNIDYFRKHLGELKVPLYSNVPDINSGLPFKSVTSSRLADYLDDIALQDNDLQDTDSPENDLKVNDFRVSRYSLERALYLERDFSYPRLGFQFGPNLCSIGIGAKNAVEPMRQTSSLVHTVMCNFGAPVSVLLVPAVQSGFMYRVGHSHNTVRDIDFRQPDFDKYPALKKIFGYVAELGHGDSLYVPAGFWCCTANHGFSINLSFESVQANFPQYLASAGKTVVNRLLNTSVLSDKRLSLLEREIVSRTNAALLRASKR